MKRGFIFLLVFVPLYVICQEPPIYYHYLFNKSYINPAFAGSEMKAKVKIADMHSRILKSNMPNYQVISLTDRLGKSGLSWSIMSEREAEINAKDFQLTYAYHILLKENRRYNNNTYLSLGASVLATLFVDEEGANENNSGNPRSSINSDLSPNMNFGAYLYNNDYFAGLSMARPFFYPYPALDMVDGVNMNTLYLFAMGGYKFYSEDKKSFIEPSILIAIKGDGQMASDVTVKGLYLKKYGISLTHRMIERMNVMNHYAVPVLSYIHRNYEFGYSLDIPVGGHDGYSLYHHRFYFSYTVADRCNSRLKDCPAYW